MKFYCIADEDTVRGFRLAGVSGESVASSAGAASALERAAARGDDAIIIVTEKVADTVRLQLDRIRLEWPRPLIVEIPGPDGPLAGRRSWRQVAQEALGIPFEPQSAQ